MDLLWVFISIFLTVYGQLIIKWQMVKVGSFSDASSQKIYRLLVLLLNPWIISALFAAFLASLTWMVAITKLQLSYAYPYTSLSFILVLTLSVLFFREEITLPRIIGMTLIVLGILIGSLL